MKFKYRKINLKDPFSDKKYILRPIIPVSLQYKDSLQNAIREVGESNARIRVLREQIDNKPNLLYSWAALFMD